MLSITGKVAAMVTIAGGALLLDASDAKAKSMRECTPEEFNYACTAGAPSYFDGGEYWCGYPVACTAIEDDFGVHLSWNYYFTPNGQDPCPPTLPC